MALQIFAGRFDPKFPGITIRVRDRVEAQSFRLHDSRRKSPPEILAAMNDDAVVSDLSRQTVVCHEARHFHDALLFPFGDRAIRSRINASFNGYLAAMTLRDRSEGATALVVPLRQWLVMPEAEREALLDDARRTTRRAWTVPRLPVIPADDTLDGLVPGAVIDDEAEYLAGACRVTLADYRLVERLWRSPHADGEPVVFAAIDAWEGSALLCQFARIEEQAGTAAMERFRTWVHRAGPAAYRRALDELERCCAALGWAPTPRNALALSTWSQMGAYVTETLASSPGHRLGSVVAAAGRGRRWSRETPFLDLVAGWDEVAGADSVAALVAGRDSFDRFARGSAMAANGMAALLPAELFTALSGDRHRMVDAFLRDPDRYVDPAAYAADDTAYPQPPVSVQYPGGSDGQTLWDDVTPAHWSPAIGFDAGARLAAMAEIADAVFLPGDKSLQTAGRAVIAERLGLEAYRIIG